MPDVRRRSPEGRGEEEEVLTAETTRRGQGLLEFALVLPILLLIILAVINFGYLFAAHTSLEHAASEGVRYGIVHPLDTAGVCTRIVEQALLTNLQPAEITVSYPQSGEDRFTCDVPVGLVDSPDEDQDQVDPGDDLGVEINHTLRMPIPLIQNSLNVHVVTTRTIRSVKN